MFEADLHAHSFFSSCGLHSIVEILNASKKKGLKAQAVTDHGPHLGRRVNSSFFQRLNNPVDGIILLKGMECNITDDAGNIDVITDYMQWYDLLLLGLHDFDKTNNTPEYYSKLIIKSIQKNPFIDVIVHPNTDRYLTNFTMLTEAAVENDIAIELNNSKLNLGRASDEKTIELIECCKRAGCNVVVSTDAHALNEVGEYTAIEKILAKTDFPKEKIINYSLKTTLDWIEKRKARRIKSLDDFLIKR